MTDDADYQGLLQVWGTEEALQVHLEKIVAQLCPMICGVDAPVPVVEPRPSWVARALLGGRSARAQYEPAEAGQPPKIAAYPGLFLQPDLLRRVLAHELIHHWEHLGAVGAEALGYPDDADARIAGKYGDSAQGRSWGAAHSRSFVAKAASVATSLAQPLAVLLFDDRGA